MEVISYSDSYKRHLCRCSCGNLVWLTKRQLKHKHDCGCKKKKYNEMYQHDGIDGTIKEICEFFNLSYSSTMNKLSHGWNIQDCFDMPYRFTGKLYNLNGWEGNVYHFSKKFNIPEYILKRNLNKTNDDIEQAINLYLNKTERLYYYNGRSGTAHKLAFYNNVNPALVYRRLNLGWSIDDAIGTPVKDEFNDITGKKYNNLTVIKRVKLKNGINGWLCRCDCGNYKELTYNQITSGRCKSCGCSRKRGIELTPGQKFGMLTVIEDTGIRNSSGRPIVRCICDCGNECLGDYSHIKRGAKKSCGCLRKNRRTS